MKTLLFLFILSMSALCYTSENLSRIIRKAIMEDKLSDAQNAVLEFDRLRQGNKRFYSDFEWINDRDIQNKTLIQHAIIANKPEFIKLLLQFGAKVNEKEVRFARVCVDEKTWFMLLDAVEDQDSVRDLYQKQRVSKKRKY